jgi:hypothetical protein
MTEVKQSGLAEERTRHAAEEFFCQRDADRESQHSWQGRNDDQSNVTHEKT